MAVVTFGGAYAVLAYVAQEAVQTFGWLKPGEMLDGLGMAETTPGPLIMVLQFVGFMAAYRDPGSMHPMLAGTLGGILTTWVTFVPCFLWIFLGAPYVEALRGNKALSAALADHHRRGRRRGPQSGRVVWLACAVRRNHRSALARDDDRNAGTGLDPRRVAGVDGGGPCRGVPLQDQHDRGIGPAPRLVSSPTWLPDRSRDTTRLEPTSLRRRVGWAHMRFFCLLRQRAAAPIRFGSQGLRGRQRPPEDTAR